MSDCPCGSSVSLEDCCGPYLSGTSKAPTAEALMRSRYTAYATGATDYVVATHDPKKRISSLREQVEKWARGAQFTSLEVRSTDGGGPGDSLGEVEFVATYLEDGKTHTLREISTFRKIKGAWFYVGGKTPHTETVVRPDLKVGRNDPCPCGSGKKYKKCCA